MPYMHFGYISEVKKMKADREERAKEAWNPPSVDIEDVADYIEQAVQQMIDEGAEHGNFKLRVPDYMNEEQAQQFIEDILEELNRRLGGDDKFGADFE